MCIVMGRRAAAAEAIDWRPLHQPVVGLSTCTDCYSQLTTPLMAIDGRDRH